MIAGGRSAEDERPGAIVIVHGTVRAPHAYGADAFVERAEQRNHGILEAKHDLAEPLYQRVAVAVSS